MTRKRTAQALHEPRYHTAKDVPDVRGRDAWEQHVKSEERKEHNQLQARNNDQNDVMDGKGSFSIDQENVSALEVGRNPRPMMRCLCPRRDVEPLVKDSISLNATMWIIDALQEDLGVSSASTVAPRHDHGACECFRQARGPTDHATGI